MYLCVYVERNSPKEWRLLEQIVVETQFTEAYIREKSKKILKKSIILTMGLTFQQSIKFTHKVIRSLRLIWICLFHFEVSLDTEVLLQVAIDALISQAGIDEELTKLLVDFSISKADDDKSLRYQRTNGNWSIAAERKTTNKNWKLWKTLKCKRFCR